MTLSGDELIELFKGGKQPDDDGEREYALLQAFFDGYPSERLRELLYSENVYTATLGAWIASELPVGGRNLVGDFKQLLKHPDSEVRYWIVAAVLGSASSANGDVVAAAVRTVDDPDVHVREHALSLLAHARTETLAAAVEHLESNAQRILLSWLIDVDRTLDVDTVIGRLDSSEHRDRLFAAAAAYRIAMLRIDPPMLAKADPGARVRRHRRPDYIIRDQRALEHAARSTDPVIRSFAELKLESIAGWQRLQIKLQRLAERRPG
jgi:hypothetical protein